MLSLVIILAKWCKRISIYVVSVYFNKMQPTDADEWDIKEQYIFVSFQNYLYKNMIPYSIKP